MPRSACQPQHSYLMMPDSSHLVSTCCILTSLLNRYVNLTSLDSTRDCYLLFYLSSERFGEWFLLNVTWSSCIIRIWGIWQLIYSIWPICNIMRYGSAEWRLCNGKKTDSIYPIQWPMSLRIWKKCFLESVCKLYCTCSVYVISVYLLAILCYWCLM